MKPADILIVEDEVEIADLIRLYLINEGFTVHICHNGADALQSLRIHSFDLTILDIMLPGLSGFDICKILRRKSNCPIVFLTALGTEDNILRGYEIGADEYMVKLDDFIRRRTSQVLNLRNQYQIRESFQNTVPFYKKGAR